MQDQGHDTVTANLMLNHEADPRTYDVAVEILKDLQIKTVNLMTNNPTKIEMLQKGGIEIKSRIPLLPKHWHKNSANNNEKQIDKIEHQDKQSCNAIEDAMESKINERVKGEQQRDQGEEEEESNTTYSRETTLEIETLEVNGTPIKKGNATNSSSNSSHHHHNVKLTCSPDMHKELDNYLLTKIRKMNHMVI